MKLSATARVAAAAAVALGLAPWAARAQATNVSSAVDQIIDGLPNLNLTSSQDPTRLTTPPAGSALWTDEVAYCSENRSIEVNAVDITLWRANATLSFGFSFASVAQNLELEALVYLTAYDNPIKNLSINLCEVLGSVCQLSIPRFNLTGFGDYALPDGWLNDIPAIGWTMPDLDAHARVEIIDKSTGRTATCLQARLTNGWSVESTAVKWATGMFTLAAFILALLQSLRRQSSSPALYRWFDILILYQTAAASGLMAVDYPRVWVSFTRNVAWSLAILRDGNMQGTINKMRRNSGGKMPYTAYEDLPFINRTLADGVSANNGIDFGGGNSISFHATTLRTLVKTLTEAATGLAARLTSRALVPDSEEQQNAMALKAGVPIYVNGEGIPEANAYSTVFLWFLCFLALMVGVHLVIGAVMLLVSATTRSKAPKWIVHLRRTWWQFCAANFFRICLAWTFPIAIFGFYQWKIGKNDAAGPIGLSVLGWILCIVPLAVVWVVEMLKNRKQSLTNPNVSRLWTDYRFFHAAGLLYRQYHVREHYFWFIPVVLGLIAKAGFISFGNRNQWAQVIGCMVVEFLTLVIIIIFRPYRGIWNGILAFFLCFLRLAVFALLITDIDSVGVKAIPRTVIGMVQIALVGIATVLLLVDMIWTLVYDLFGVRRRYDDYDDLESPFYDDTVEKDPSSLRATLVGNDELGESTAHAPAPAAGFTDPYDPKAPGPEPKREATSPEQMPLSPDLYEQQQQQHLRYSSGFDFDYNNHHNPYSPPPQNGRRTSYHGY